MCQKKQKTNKKSNEERNKEVKKENCRKSLKYASRKIRSDGEKLSA